jgi:hypothetical protein
MVRIKYDSVDNLLYTDWFTIGPNLIVRGIINTLTFQYQVIEFNTDVVAEGQASNLRNAKHQLKNVLGKAGVNFEGEIRNLQ